MYIRAPIQHTECICYYTWFVPHGRNRDQLTIPTRVWAVGCEKLLVLSSVTLDSQGKGMCAKNAITSEQLGDDISALININSSPLSLQTKLDTASRLAPHQSSRFASRVRSEYLCFVICDKACLKCGSVK